VCVAWGSPLPDWRVCLESCGLVGAGLAPYLSCSRPPAGLPRRPAVYGLGHAALSRSASAARGKPWRTAGSAVVELVRWFAPFANVLLPRY